MNAQENEPQKNLAGDGAPFIFGVSGHRDLVETDLPELRANVQRIYDRFAAAHPRARFQLLSPLADGADRLAAEAALASGFELIVPLPMAQSDYERDFTEAESLNDFRRLLAAADDVFEVDDEGRNSAAATDDTVRAGRYAAVGDYIARRSHVLILLWDGKVNQKVGGTAWVKQRREYWMQAGEAQGEQPPDFGYVGMFQVVTPRQQGNGEPARRIEIIGKLPEKAGAT